MIRYSTLVARFSPFVVLLSVAVPAVAQDEHRSHVPVPLPADVDPAQLFGKRILESQEQAGLADLLKQLGKNGGINQGQLSKLLKDNPQLGDLVGGFQSKDPEKSNRVQELLRNALHAGRLPGNMSPNAIEEQLRNLQLRPDVAGVPPIQSGRPPMPPSPPERPPIDPAEQSRKRELANQLAEWAERFPRDKLPESVRNSPAVKDAFQRLTEAAADALRSPTGADGLDALTRLETRFQSVREWLPKEMPAALRSLHLPDLSRFAPNVRVPQFEVSPPTLPSAPHFGGPGVDARSAANVLLAGIAVVVVAVVAWRLFGGRLSPTVGGRQPIGPWPLDPMSVGTRAELIRAFEYLSLLRCGEPARTWHHLAIAECLGGIETDRQAAAARLAELYEQARYAPAAAGEPDWSTARGPLSLLAGVR
jgi:hypothetical protein